MIDKEEDTQELARAKFVKGIGYVWNNKKYIIGKGFVPIDSLNLTTEEKRRPKYLEVKEIEDQKTHDTVALSIFISLFFFLLLFFLMAIIRISLMV
jgi:hypothetical protein